MHKEEKPAVEKQQNTEAGHHENHDKEKKAHEKHGGHATHGHHAKVYPILNPGSIRNRNSKKFNLPVIGHFADRSIEFKSILQAEEATGIPYQMIFEACVGKIFKAKNVIWEFKKGNHYIKYKAFYINAQESFKLSAMEREQERIAREKEKMEHRKRKD